MPYNEKVIGDLLAIKTYFTSKAIEAKRKTVREEFMECARNIDDSITLLKEQQERIETLESLRRIEQEGR